MYLCSRPAFSIARPFFWTSFRSTTGSSTSPTFDASSSGNELKSRRTGRKRLASVVRRKRYEYPDDGFKFYVPLRRAYYSCISGFTVPRSICANPNRFARLSGHVSAKTYHEHQSDVPNATKFTLWILYSNHPPSFICCRSFSPSISTSTLQTESPSFPIATSWSAGDVCVAKRLL